MMPLLSSLSTSTFINCASSTFNLRYRVAIGLTAGYMDWNKRGALKSAVATLHNLVGGMTKELNNPPILNVIK